MDTTVNTNHVVTVSAQPTTDDSAHAPDVLRLHSLAELGQVLSRFATTIEADDTGHPSLEEALALLASSESDLAAAIARDADARHAAEDLLARYDQARERAQRAGVALTRANALVSRATALADHAFTPAAQGAARLVLPVVRRAADAAAREHEQATAEVASLADDPRVQRLLAEREAREEAERAAAEQARRRQQLQRAVAEAQALADHRQFAEAIAILAPFVPQFPDEQPLRAFFERCQRRARMVRSQRARAILWEIRRRLRSRPAEVLVAVEQIDVADLDDDLARQLFGEWLRAGRLLDLPGALRHTPAPHRGALLVPRGSGGTLTVVSAVGGYPLRKGQAVQRQDLSGLRPVADRR